MENPMEKCSRCHFRTKNGDLLYCSLVLRDITEESQCTVEIDELDNEAVAEVLRCHNVWRRGADIDPVPPRLLGLALDKAYEILNEAKEIIVIREPYEIINEEKI